MSDFSSIINKAKELESKMKESHEKIKSIKVDGVSGSNSVKVILDGEGEMVKIEISHEILKEEKSIKILTVFIRATPIMEILTGIMIAILIFYSGILIVNEQLSINNFFFKFVIILFVLFPAQVKNRP